MLGSRAWREDQEDEQREEETHEHAGAPPARVERRAMVRVVEHLLFLSRFARSRENYSSKSESFK